MLDHIDVAVTVDWHEQFKVLKLRFLINTHFHAATSQIPYGPIGRGTNGEEQPGGSWLDLSGTSRLSDAPYGMAIQNDSKYSYGVHIREVGLTVLRSPIYAHHGPMAPQHDQIDSFMDQGTQRFRHAILPHTGGRQDAGVVRRAAEINTSPIALMDHMGPEGFLPFTGSFPSVEPLNVITPVLKLGEDADDVELRCYESSGEAAVATMRLPNLERTFTASFGPNEIKTFLIPRDAGAAVREVNLIEWPHEDYAARVGREGRVS